jgi:hypothetical protein
MSTYYHSRLNPSDESQEFIDDRQEPPNSSRNGGALNTTDNVEYPSHRRTSDPKTDSRQQGRSFPTETQNHSQPSSPRSHQQPWNNPNFQQREDDTQVLHPPGGQPLRSQPTMESLHELSLYSFPFLNGPTRLDYFLIVIFTWLLILSYLLYKLKLTKQDKTIYDGIYA